VDAFPFSLFYRLVNVNQGAHIYTYLLLGIGIPFLIFVANWNWFIF